MPMMKVLGTHNSVMALGLATGLLLSGAAAAYSQSIWDPNRSPDLMVRVDAPVSVNAYEMTYVTIQLDNLAPLVGLWRAGTASNVDVSIDLTGLTPQTHWASNGITCGWRGGAFPGWSVYGCSGSIPWGSSATIYIWVVPSNDFYCGRPVYTDAAVTTSGPERSTANNRAIARSNLVGCIG